MANARNIKKFAKKALDREQQEARKQAAHARKVNSVKATNRYKKRMGQKEEPIPVGRKSGPSPSANVKRGSGRRTEEQRKQDKRDRKEQAAPHNTSDHKTKNIKSERKAKGSSTSSRTTSNRSYLDATTPSDGFIGSALGTTGTLFGSLKTGLKEEGAWKQAGKKVLQTSAASAAGHGGLAFLQGDDPWEAAKTGAFRGAVAGAGYQGLKIATHSNAGSIKGNLKSIGSGTKSAYKANTTAGNAAMREGPQVSNQLKKILEAKHMNNQSKGFFGF